MTVSKCHHESVHAPLKDVYIGHVIVLTNDRAALVKWCLHSVVLMCMTGPTSQLSASVFPLQLFLITARMRAHVFGIVRSWGPFLCLLFLLRAVFISQCLCLFFFILTCFISDAFGVCLPAAGIACSAIALLTVTCAECTIWCRR